MMMVILSRLYADNGAAGNAIGELRAAGLPEKDLALIASTHRMRIRNPDAQHDRFDDDPTVASDERVGAVSGGGAGLLAGLGMLALPGIGPVIAAGWLVTAIAGAVADGAAGGVIGALVEAGVSQKDAALYVEGVRRGGTLIAIRTAAETREFYEEILGCKLPDWRFGDTARLRVPDPRTG